MGGSRFVIDCHQFHGGTTALVGSPLPVDSTDLEKSHAGKEHFKTTGWDTIVTPSCDSMSE
jgi:hypothetical protein